MCFPVNESPGFGVQFEAPAETPAQTTGQLNLEEAHEIAAEHKARQRMLGNVQFIGQLYNKGMLSDNIMHQCIVKLLGEVRLLGDRIL